jgi:excisionase family DNA binding protein
MISNDSQIVTPSNAGQILVAPRYLSVAKAATVSGLSRSTLYNFMKSGSLDYVKAGSRRLIFLSELDDFMARLPHGGSLADV